MKRWDFIILLVGAAVAWPLAVYAQETGKLPRVGYLGNSTAALEANLVGPFRDGLRELGYEEGATSWSNTVGLKESMTAFPP